MEVITTHINSDFDALGAMVAARKLYPGAICAFPGSQEKSLRNFFLASSLYASGFEKAKNIDLEKITRLILVDVDQPSRIGRFAPLVGKKGVEVHVYDHHPRGEGSVSGDYGKIENVGATTTLLAEILFEKKIPIEPAEATVMLLGIFEDTGRLSFSSTTPRDFFAAGKLVEMGADLNAVASFLEPEMTAEQVFLLDELLKSLSIRVLNGVKVAVAKASAVSYVGDVALLAHKICEMENLDVLVMYVAMEGRIILVARSRVPSADVSAVAKHFGGGGHPEAASAAIKDLTPIQVDAEIERIIPLFVQPKLTAKDICTTPVKTVDALLPLEGVREALNRYHVNAMPVMAGGKLAGIITRMVVERAIGHGLSGATAGDYMTTEFSTVAPETGFDSIRALIVEGRQRFLPVVKDGVLYGAITRTDIIEILSRDLLPERFSQPKEVQSRSLKKALSDLVEPELLERLKTVGRLARGEGMHAYLVGGLVRDLFLHRKNLDVDVVIEGDGIAIAKKAALLWDAGVREHRPFGTAKVIFKDNFTIDFATARTEYYTGPAALPTVEESSLKLDLYRRDFTINTLALRLDETGFGEALDFFGGIKDIKEKKIRVLHNLSFVEDPTRIIRAFRFWARFDFRLGTQTEKLLKSAVAESFLARSRGPRLFREIKSLFEEADPLRAAGILGKYGCLSLFGPRVVFDAKAREHISAVDEVAAWFDLLYLGRTAEKWKLHFLALLEPLEDEGVGEFARAFGILDREGGEFLRLRKSAAELLLLLREGAAAHRLTDGFVHKVLKDREDEAILYAMTKTRDEKKKKAISAYFTRISGAKTLLGGRDLRALGIPPGPVYRTLLDNLLTARLDGLVSTKEEEEAWILAEWEKLGGTLERG